MKNPVNSKIAKLLKNKNLYNEPCRLCITDDDERPLPFDCGNKEHINNIHPFYSSPELGEIIMWIYDVHKLWILPIPTVTGYFAYKILDVQLDPSNIIERPPYTGVSALDYHNPIEAYEAAIEEILEGII